MRKYLWVFIPALLVTICILAVVLYSVWNNHQNYTKKVDSISANWVLLSVVKTQMPCLYDTSKENRFNCRVQLDAAILSFHDNSDLAIGTLVCAQSLSQSFSLTDNPYVTPDRIALINITCQKATDALNEELKNLK